MLTITMRHGEDSGIRLWRVECPDHGLIGYHTDLGSILLAMLADGETAVTLETPSGRVRLALLDAPGPVEPSPIYAPPDA